MKNTFVAIALVLGAPMAMASTAPIVRQALPQVQKIATVASVGDVQAAFPPSQMIAAPIQGDVAPALATMEIRIIIPKEFTPQPTPALRGDQ